MFNKRAHLLLVEDEAPLREATAERLAEEGYRVVQAGTGEAALEQLAEFAFDVVLTDLRLPGVDGTKVLAAALDRYPDIVGIVVTGFGTIRDGVDAIKQGAAEFITKPFQLDQLLHVVGSALEQRRLRSENAYLRSQLEERYRFEGLVGRSRLMRELFDLLETVAASPSTVLVTGETGTGKELIARAIHHNSPRRHHRFVALNCGAVPDTLLEAELFGHVRGAFTGAVAQRVGRFELADGGTLLLDEIGEISPSLQAKLLRVLEEEEFERVGGNTTMKVDVRIIATTGTWITPPREFAASTPDMVAPLYVRETLEGIEGTGIKAGIIKASTDKGGVTDVGEILLRAVARAHHQTDVPISTHTYSPGRVGEEPAERGERSVCRGRSHPLPPF